MINVTGFRYCRLGTADLEETVKFATEIIGLEHRGLVPDRIAGRHVQHLDHLSVVMGMAAHGDDGT